MLTVTLRLRELNTWRNENRACFYRMEEESMNLKLRGFINEYKECSAMFRELRILI